MTVKMAKHLSEKHFFKQPNSSGASDKCDEKTGNDVMGRKDRQLSVTGSKEVRGPQAAGFPPGKGSTFRVLKTSDHLPVNVDPKFWIYDNV